MQICKTITSLNSALEAFSNAGKSISFIPTMGALHAGHISLIEIGQQHADVTVCSIFVNPTQFNQQDDLEKYPRNLDADVKLLESVGCDILFYPTVETIYPNGTDEQPEIDLQGLDQKLEGAFRPGHFEGVVQVVKRLLDIVKPDALIMGQKDFQQFTIIQYMLDYFEIATKLVVAPIKREDHGLARSSRNERLPSNIRQAANIIYRTLIRARRQLGNISIAGIQASAFQDMTFDDFRPEYFEIIDGNTLDPIEGRVQDYDYIVAVTAVWAGDVRLIDNMILKGSKQ